LTGRLGTLLQRGDSNKDGSLDKAELNKVFEGFRGGRPGARGKGAGARERDGEKNLESGATGER